MYIHTDPQTLSYVIKQITYFNFEVQIGRLSIQFLQRGALFSTYYIIIFPDSAVLLSF